MYDALWSNNIHMQRLCILESCPDEKVKENGRNAGETIVKDLLLTMGVTPSYAFVIFILKKLLSEFAGWFECDHHIKGGKGGSSFAP